MLKHHNVCIVTGGIAIHIFHNLVRVVNIGINDNTHSHVQINLANNSYCFNLMVQRYNKKLK